MNKKTISWIGILLIIIIISLTGWYLLNNRKLVMSGHPQWAPIMYQQGNKIIGAGPEIGKLILDKLGIKSISKHQGTWDEVQNKTKTGNVDIIVAAYKTSEREKYMDYSIPYTLDPVILIVKKDNVFSYKKWDDLIGKKGVATIGDSYGEEFDNFITNSLTMKRVERPEEAFELLDNNTVDYFVYALYSAKDYIHQNNIEEEFEILPTYVSAENFYFTFSKNSPYQKILPDFNLVLQNLIDDGTVENIIKKHKKILWGENE